MDALILAAGLGSRLRPITDNKPKAMVQFQGKEIIYHQIKNLLDHEINKIIIVTGYQSNVLHAFLDEKFGNQKFTIIENREFDSSNSAFSFMHAHEKIESDSYIHLNCDILFSKILLKKIIENKNENIIAGRSDISLADKMENIIIKNNRIVNMCLRNSKDSSHKGFGLAKISREAIEENISQYNRLNEDTQRIENYYGLIRMSLGNIEYYLEESNKNELAEVNTHEDLDDCEFILEN